MESIKDILEARNGLKPKKTALYWQELALEIIKSIDPPKKKYSSIFKTCKDDVSRAKRAFITCEELNKFSIDYYFKVYNEYGKQK